MSGLQDIIARLQEVLDAMDGADPGDMAGWRDRIDVLDQVLVHLLNERSPSAYAIGHIKKQVNAPIYVPEREIEVLSNVLKGNPGPLENEAVRRLFERIIDETRSLERRKYQDPE